MADHIDIVKRAIEFKKPEGSVIDNDPLTSSSRVN